MDRHAQIDDPVKTQGEHRVYMPRRKVSGGTSPRPHLERRLPASKTTGDKCVLFKPLSLWDLFGSKKIHAHLGESPLVQQPNPVIETGNIQYMNRPPPKHRPG